MSSRSRRASKPSSKLAFLEDQSRQWEQQEQQLAATRASRKKKKRKVPEKVCDTCALAKPWELIPTAQVQVVVKKPSKAPKLRKPTSALLFFSKAMRDRVMVDYPDATVNERTAIVNEM